MSEHRAHRAVFDKVAPHLWWISLISILLLASCLRFYNIYENPGFHPDERGVVMIAQKLSWTNLKPESFHYGSFAYFLLWFSGQATSYFFPKATNYDAFFIIGRTLSALSGVLCVLLSYLLAMRLYASRQLALAAAFFLCCNVLHIQLSRFYAVDMLLTVCCTAALWAITRIAQRREKRFYVWAGIFLGLAVGTKISALSLGLAVATALLLYHRAQRRWCIPAVLLNALLLVASMCLVLFVVEPHLYFDFKQFWSDNQAQVNMTKGAWKPPYTLQYEQTTPYLYHLKQLWCYTFGPVTGSLLGLGLIASFWQSCRGRSLPALAGIVWAVAMFIAVGGLFVKFPRYFLPIYPLLSIFAAHGLLTIVHMLRRIRAPAIATGVQIVVFSLVGLYGVSWMNIYRQPHSWPEASEWIYRSLAPGSTLLHVHWDDTLPLNLPGKSRADFTFQTLPLYERTSPEKTAEILAMLAGGDYFIFATSRTYRALPRSFGHHLFSASLLQELFTGELGYDPLRCFKQRPSIFGWSLTDELADESFSVYDHPQVLIFENTRRLSESQLMAAITKAQSRAPLLQPKDYLSLCANFEQE